MDLMFSLRRGAPPCVTTFCQYEGNSTNALLKECGNGSWGLFTSVVNCLQTHQVERLQDICYTSNSWTDKGKGNVQHFF